MDFLSHIAILFFVIMGICYFSSVFKKKKDEEETVPFDSENVGKEWAVKQKDIVDNALRELNCEVNWSQDNEETFANYDYQGGHFKLIIDNRSPYVKLNYLYCFSDKLDKLTLVRIAANKCNINSENMRMVYSINKEQNEVNIHILSDIMLHPDNAKFLLKRNMAAAFVWQNTLARQFAEVEQQSKSIGDYDTEKVMAELGREIALMRRQENVEADAMPPLHTGKELMQMKSFIAKAMGLDGFKPDRMLLQNAERSETKDSEDEIMHFNLADALPEGANGTAHIFVWGKLPDMPSVERTITMAFSSEAGNGKGGLFRVTATLVPLTADPRGKDGGMRGRTLTCSVLMANAGNDNQLLKEAEYMWKEAVQKAKNEEYDTLTQQQKFVAKCTDEDIAVRLYNGKKLFLEERYYEALLFFEEAFYAMQSQFDTMKKSQKDTFFETIFHIGFCYGALGQYTKAMAFLDMVSPLHKIPYAMEMINCMVNSGDFRAENAVDTLVSTIREGMMLDDDEKPAAHLVEFLAFLDRRKTSILLNKGKYAEAKKMLKKMLNDPHNADFAIDELAHLQRKEKGEK